MTTIEAHAGEDIETFAGRMIDLKEKENTEVVGIFNGVKLSTEICTSPKEFLNAYYASLWVEEDVDIIHKQQADYLKERISVLRKTADELEEMLKEMGEK
jgi:hypothetical protein